MPENNIGVVSTIDKPALEWMRGNAPDAVKELSDSEVVEQMSGAYRRHVCDNLLAQWQRMA